MLGAVSALVKSWVLPTSCHLASTELAVVDKGIFDLFFQPILFPYRCLFLKMLSWDSQFDMLSKPPVPYLTFSAIVSRSASAPVTRWIHRKTKHNKTKQSNHQQQNYQQTKPNKLKHHIYFLMNLLFFWLQFMLEEECYWNPAPQI